MYAASPGYSLDLDLDGVACETGRPGHLASEVDFLGIPCDRGTPMMPTQRCA
ncbi:hypothetical protein [Rhodococcus oxybenzonivorans]|uniref:hypothetical protein n=1 Tax=Rhodococcus oxybenzonivorans TaxID=1990687 RepID=UPI001E5FBA73